MTRVRLALTAFLFVVATAAAMPLRAAVIFSDDFEDGNVSDWTVSSSAGVITPVVTVRSDSVHAGSYALYTYFDAPTGGTGANFVRATHSFTAPTAGNYMLDLWARSSPCSGCTMFFDVLVDGVLLAHDGTSPSAFKSVGLSLPGLTASAHTLTLGMYTDAAFSGRFNASFDDVVITSIPEPATVALLGAGLLVLGFARRRARS